MKSFHFNFSSRPGRHRYKPLHVARTALFVTQYQFTIPKRRRDDHNRWEVAARST
ncbi:hypothetical protein BDZ89DRAFT_1059538 [Hymenopellis radicata]|nr:hypothetical protein BDZ89DRAFT_1059538 [Hymenopellis radicata]